jgi:hypothetical protein
MTQLNEEMQEARGFRRCRACIVLLVGITILGAGTAQGRKKEPKSQPPSPSEQISRLGTELYGQDLEDSENITNKIQQLVLGHLEAWIQNRSPSGVEVRREIESLFSKLRYPAFADANVFESPWKGEELIGAGYTLGWSDIWRRNVVVLFSSRDGQTQKLALTNFVPRTDLHYVVLPPSASGDFRFIIYGSRLGASSPRLTAILYTFDGKTLQPSWEVHDLFAGDLSVQGNELVIQYLNEKEFIRDTAQGHYPPRYQDTYTITPQGIELASRREVPF